MAWDAKHWEWESNRATWFKEIDAVVNFHESKMIHGRYASNTHFFVIVYFSGL